MSDLVLEGLRRQPVSARAGAVAAIVVVALLSMLVRPHPMAAAPAPLAPLKSVDRLIRSATIEGATLTVRAEIPGTPDYGDIRLAGSTAEAVGRAVQRGGYVENLSGVKTVVIVASAGTQGQPSPAPFLSFSLSGDDLRAAQYETLGPTGVLDLAQTVQSNGREAAKALADYCVKYSSASRHFCSKAGG